MNRVGLAVIAVGVLVFVGGSIPLSLTSVPCPTTVYFFGANGQQIGTGTLMSQSAASSTTIPTSTVPMPDGLLDISYSAWYSTTLSSYAIVNGAVTPPFYGSSSSASGSPPLNMGAASATTTGSPVYAYLSNYVYGNGGCFQITATTTTTYVAPPTTTQTSITTQSITSTIATISSSSTTTQAQTTSSVAVSGPAPAKPPSGINPLQIVGVAIVAIGGFLTFRRRR